jgi:hypothetical protein
MQAVRHPARAGQERAFLRAVRSRPGAPDQAILGQFAPDRLDRGDHSRITGRQKADQRQQQQARIEFLAAIILREAPAPFIPAFPADILMDLAPRGAQPVRQHAVLQIGCA